MTKDITFTRKPIASILYDEVKFNFVIDHWNYHLVGTCIFNGKFCMFESVEPDYDHNKEGWCDIYVNIYNLSWLERQKFKIKQWLFEKCVGYHWSYKNGKKIAEKPNITWLTDFYYKFLN